MGSIRLKDLESELQGLNGFNSPKVELEQYVTSAHLASRMIFTAQSSYEDILNKSVLDLGCGCGILSIASNLVGSSYTLGVDLDWDALEVARSNLSSLDLEDSRIDFLRADLSNPQFLKLFKSPADHPDGSYQPSFDTVVMNPPFGTKNKGVDMLFLEIACRMARSSVYSLHKTSTRKFIQKKAKEYGFQAEVLAEMRVRSMIIRPLLVNQTVTIIHS